jgi:hypothetical protein
LQQEAQVSELSGWLVFVKNPGGRPVKLPDLGGVYADLYADLVARVEASQKLAACSEKENLKTQEKASKIWILSGIEVSAQEWKV